jgi:uncharacterized protein
MRSSADLPALVVMAKRPQAGRTKTRLCPPLSPQQAADLYEAFLRDVLQAGAALPGVQLAVAVTPPDAQSLDYFRDLAPPGTLLLPVTGATIGRCLDAALSALLERGHRRVAAVSSDSPTVQPALIATAFERLSAADVVLSPGDDGGYYLIGVKARYPQLFADDIPWSTEAVAARTLARARELGLLVDLAPPILDVDTVEDLQRLRSELARLPEEVAAHTRRALRSL